MKTLFLTISRGGTARNLLQNNFFDSIKRAFDRVVIITPGAQSDRFKKEFGADKVIFEDMFEYTWKPLDQFFVGLQKMLVYNASTEVRDRYGIFDPKEGNYLKYILKKIIFFPLSKIGWLKEVVRFFDYVVVPPSSRYDGLFQKYQPSILFAGSAMEDMEVDIIKTAKKFGVKTVGMGKTWDNLSKMAFRAKTDEFLVWGQYSKEEAIRFQNYDPKHIHICGIPQYDNWIDSNLESRDAYCSRVGLDHTKKIIVYGSEGRIATYDPDIVSMIVDEIRSGKLPPSQVYIRPHQMYVNDREKFKQFEGIPEVVIDAPWNPDTTFRDNWDYSITQLQHFRSILSHMDVLVTSTSTLTLDGAVLDKPIINIAFDGFTKKPFAESVAHWYGLEYYKKITESGANWVVHSKDELIDAIHIYLQKPETRHSERNALTEYFGFKMDGKAGERMVAAIVEFDGKGTCQKTGDCDKIPKSY